MYRARTMNCLAAVMLFASMGLSASEIDEAMALKRDAMEIFRANTGKSVAPEAYAEGIRKLERAEALLEQAAKVDPDKAEPLQREVASARFWAQRFANVQVADALHDQKSKAPEANKTAPPATPPEPEKPPAAVAITEPPKAKAVKTVEESALSVAADLDKSAAQLLKEGKEAEASKKLLQSLMSKAGANPNKIAELGDYFQAQGKYLSALEYYKLLVKESEKRYGPDDALLAMDLDKLASIYTDLGNYTQSEALHLRILKIRQRFYGAEHAEVANTMSRLGYCYLNMGKFDLAETWLKRAMDMRKKLFKETSWELANSHRGLGNLYKDQGKYAQAEAELTKAYIIAAEVYGPADPRIVSYLDSLSRLMRVTNRFDDAEKLLNQALPIVE